MELTEELQKKYLDQDLLRETINDLEHKEYKKVITEEEKDLLATLKKFRAENFSYPSFAYYDFFEMSQLYN